MLKLYHLTETEKLYWETWDESPQSHVIHWGVLGMKGETKTIKSTFLKRGRDQVQKEINAQLALGFVEIPIDEHVTLIIEYAVDGMGSAADLDKRSRVEERMNQTLGWVGLGACDGGSIGSGSMEICCFVVDFELAKSVIEQDLSGGEFGDYTRIYDENAA